MKTLQEPNGCRTRRSEIVRELLTVKDVAAMLGRSERFVWNLHARELIPKPLKLSRSVNWVHLDILRWIDWGCPKRPEFEARKLKAGAL